MRQILALITTSLLLSLHLWAQPASALWGPDKRVGDEGKLAGHKHEIFSLAFSADGKKLASGSFDGTTRIWDSNSWQVLHELAGHGNWVSAVAFSPDSKVLVSAGIDRRIQIWDAETGANLFTSQEHAKGVLSLAYSPDGKWLASGGLEGKILIYDTQTWQVQKTLLPSANNPGGVGVLAFSPDGLWLASASYDDPVIRLWNPETGQAGPLLSDHLKEIYALSFSPNGQYLASAGEDRIIRLWDMAKRTVVSRLAGHFEPVWSLAFDPAGDFLASGSMGDGSLRFWTVPQGVNSQSLSEIPKKTYALAFDPKQKRLASGHSDALLRLWRNTNPEAASALASQSGTTLARLLEPVIEVAGLSIDDDRQGLSSGNANYSAEAGELVEITLHLRNRGTAPAQGLEATIQLAPTGLIYQGEAPRFRLETWPMGSEQTLILPVFIPKNLQEPVTLAIELRAENGAKAWKETLKLELGKAYPPPAEEGKNL
ncbi:MAG: hypothetical protein AB7I41_06000 [Candidatus Sericytochromatia bacterium]